MTAASLLQRLRGRGRGRGGGRGGGRGRHNCKQHDCCFAAAEAVGGGIAGLVAAPLYGVGAGWLKKALPWHKTTETPVGPNGVLVDKAPSKRDRAFNYMHKPTDSAGSPDGSPDAERQPLETIV